MIILGVALLGAFWMVAWPAAMRSVLRHNTRPTKLIRERAGETALIVALALAIILWVLAVWCGDRFHYHVYWHDARTQLSALGLSAAVAITYGGLFPPAIDAYFFAVDDVTGEWDADARTRLLCIPANAEKPIFLAIYNVGVTTWNAFRVNVEFGAGFVPSLKPNDVDWDWAPADLAIGRSGGWLQADRARSLSTAEPQIMRFMLKAPPKKGTTDVTITVGCAGHFGETRRKLKVQVC